MKATGQLLCLAASIAGSLAEPSLPRGVGPEFAKFYKNRDTFACISNPSIKIPYSQVNDDFCDCPDGSDEPGTAACSYLSPLSPSSPADTSIVDTIDATLALPGFYCQNKGHVPAYVPYTAVNDGICDYDLCCDGSEEYGGIVKCENKCAAIGKAARAEARDRQKTLSTALRKKRELISEAGKLRKELEDQIKDLAVQIQAADVKVQQAEATLKETEVREANKVVKGADGPLGTLVELARERSSELRESLIRVRSERDAVRNRLIELEGLLTTFKAEYNPNFNDEGVKRAVRAWEDYAARDKGPEPDSAHERDLNEIVKTDEDSGLDWDEFLAAQDSNAGDPELDLLYSFEAYLPLPVRGWLDAQLRSLRQYLIDNGVLFGGNTSSAPGSESRAVQDARSALRTAERSAKDLRSSLDKATADQDKDYGAADVFRPLKGRCISLTSGEFNYELCFLDKVTQKSKKGGGGTSLGKFDKFEQVLVDVADGEESRLAMRYDKGQTCWNGPARSTLVVLQCAEEERIVKITEEEKCVYRMEVGTPAVCEEVTIDERPRDEL